MRQLIKKSKMVPAADVTAVFDGTFAHDNECIRGIGGKPMPRRACHSFHPRENDGNKQTTGKPRPCSRCSLHPRRMNDLPSVTSDLLARRRLRALVLTFEKCPNAVPYGRMFT